MNASSGITAVSFKPVIELGLDTPELAATYDKVSVRQLEYGKELIRALHISSEASPQTDKWYRIPCT
jgi:hypothetical protein